MWRKGLMVLALTLIGLALALGSGSTGASPGNGGERAGEGFEGSVERLSPRLRDRMTGKSWRKGCPVGLGELRLIHADHWDIDGREARGELVVHERYARGMLDVLRRLHAKRFPIRRMELIDRYDADDRQSMAADNTSAFNCRFVAGTTRWSMHAYGKAIDINPRENPYVAGDFVSPPEGRPFADRRARRPGMIFRRGVVTRSFDRILGWAWLGTREPGRDFRDYQHFSSNGD